MNRLLHADIFETLPFGAKGAVDLNDRSTELAREESVPSGVSVLIRTRNEAGNLEVLLDELSQQTAKVPTQIVIVDTESTDGTLDIARGYGADIVRITQEEFTYPKSLNLGFEAAAYENVYSTVGHANLSNTSLLLAAQIDQHDGTAGSFGFALPNTNATIYERLGYLGQASHMADTVAIKKPTMGVMGANCAVYRRSAWQELGGFDLRYEAGGEDTELARRMLAAGMRIVRDPALSVHHSHGLGLLNTMKQYKHWLEVFNGPMPMDKEELANRRPDLSI
jgi:GT2 family glycosyltransferase